MITRVLFVLFTVNMYDISELTVAHDGDPCSLSGYEYDHDKAECVGKLNHVSRFTNVYRNRIMENKCVCSTSLLQHFMPSNIN